MRAGTDPVYQVLVDYAEPLMALCQRYGKRTGRDPDALWSDVVLEKWPGVYATWDPTLGPLAVHAKVAIRWYLHKQVVVRENRRRPEQLYDQAAPKHDHFTSVEAAEVLSQVSEDQAKVLRWVAMEGFTFREVGDHLGCSGRQVAKVYRDAIAELRAKARAKECERAAKWFGEALARRLGRA